MTQRLNRLYNSLPFTKRLIVNALIIIVPMIMLPFWGALVVYGVVYYYRRKHQKKKFYSYTTPNFQRSDRPGTKPDFPRGRYKEEKKF